MRLACISCSARRLEIRLQSLTTVQHSPCLSAPGRLCQTRPWAQERSAGGHFNPDGKPHGPQSAPHHAGDLPALKADGQGVADQKFVLTGLSIAEGVASVVGRAVIVHAQPDDYSTQPTGNSGGRIACGVIAIH